MGLSLSQPFNLPIKERVQYAWRYGQLVLGVGQGHYNHFITTARHLANPLDTWSEKIIKNQTKKYIMPMQKNRRGQYYPLQKWARRVGFHPSPLGIAIHPKFGLWVSIRGVVFHKTGKKRPLLHHKSPCKTCIAKPCMAVCPVGAVGDSNFDYPACRSYIQQSNQSTCVQGGCLARRACPVGKKYQYRPNKFRFHWRAMNGV